MPSSAAAAGGVGGERLQLIAAVQRKVLARDAEFRKFSQRTTQTTSSGLVDYYFAVADEPHAPEDVFDRLRWGGQFVYISKDRARVAELAHRFKPKGFNIIHAPGYVRNGPFSLTIPFLARKAYYFVARKTYLIRPREISERFTYHVELVDRTPREQVVLKAVPTLERVMARLARRFPNLAGDVIEKRARKFTDKIFPIFLTREAAMLKILQRDLPEQYASRVPRLIDLEKDEQGYVRQLRMTWLRNGGEPITQLQFAEQSADLLRALHDVAEVIHLDLRLDNVVITPRGVGFVDFGSSVRVGEDIQGSPLLSTLFEELMRTSEIQRMLERMTLSGAVTSAAISEGFQKVDKAVDFFYLALQINSPHANPDFVDLVRFDPNSAQAEALRHLTQDILKPRDPRHPPFRSAKDILIGIRDVAKRLGRRSSSA